MNGISNYYKRFHRRLWMALIRNKFNQLGNSSINFPYIITGYRFISIGDNVTILNHIWLNAMATTGKKPLLLIGDNTRINRNGTISAIKKVEIGKNVSIGENVFITDNTHEFRDVTVPIKKQPITFVNETIVGDHTWIGTNVTIIGVKIGKHCVIGANSVVTRNIPDYSVAVGSPARVIKRFNSKTQLWEPVDKFGESFLPSSPFQKVQTA